MTGFEKFGSYLRDLRKQQDPEMTQEQLAGKVGKNKMTISQIENGKNAPPQGEFLKKISTAMQLSDDEKIKLFDLAAIARNSIPNDILKYFNAHPELRNAIRRAQDKKLTDADWKKMI